MNNYTFYIDVFLPNISLYFICLLISIISLYPVIKKVINSIFDPLFLILCLTVLANSIPIFLFFTENMSGEKFIFFCLSESIFWIAYFLFQKKNPTFLPYIIAKDNVSLLCFYMLLGIYIFSNLLTYLLIGIPLLRESRLDTYTGTGLGILGQFQTFSSFYCIVYAFYLFFNKKKYRFISFFTILVSIVFSFLSGSKGAVLGIVSGFYIYKKYYEEKELNLKSIKKYLPYLFLFPLVVIMVQSGGNMIQAMGAFLFRLMGSGDGYWMGFANDGIDNIEIKERFLYLFSRILAPLRIIDYSSVETPIGVQLHWMLVPDDVGIIKGPNTRFTMLGWTLFRWYGLLLSFVLGAFCAFWRTQLLKFFPKGIITAIIYGYIYVSFCAFFIDPMLGMSSIFNLFIFYFLLYFIYLCVNGRYVKIIPY